MRWGQVFGSGISAWLVKAVLWVAVGFAAMGSVAGAAGPGAVGHDAFNTGIALVIGGVLAFVDGILMLVIGGILVAIVRRGRMTWRSGLLAGAVQGGLLAGWAVVSEHYSRFGLITAAVLMAVELVGAVVGVWVWRAMQRDTDVTQAF